MTWRIAILGDFDVNKPMHHALNNSIRHAMKRFNEDIQFDWIRPDLFSYKTPVSKLYSGLWIPPETPFTEKQNLLDVIEYARQNSVPTFGNCGGFQHMAIEFARNVCGIAGADHEELNPNSKNLIISKLSCSLIQKEEDLTLLDTDSILFNTINSLTMKGRYICRYGLNGHYVEMLKSNELKLTAWSSDGQVRAFEISNHPFFVGTLFQPALTSTFEEPNPLIIRFIRNSINTR